MHATHPDASSPALNDPVAQPTHPPPPFVRVPAGHGTITDTLLLADPKTLDTVHDTLSVDPPSPDNTVYVNDCVVAVPPWGSVHDTATVPPPWAGTENVTTLPTDATDLSAVTDPDGSAHTLPSCVGFATVGQLSSEFATPSPSPSSPQLEGLPTSTAYPVEHVVHAELVHASQEVPHDAHCTGPSPELLS